MSSYLARPILLSALLLATLSGCAIYDPRPPMTGSTSVDIRVQDREIAEDRLARIAKTKEWADDYERARIVRFHRYFE
jgi:hypothetical protein